MAAVDVNGAARRRLSSPRIAEAVADELRRQIIDGELADGDLLPPQAVLVERFNVSLVSLREALRVLETEGLLSIRRGNRGGSVVHAPTKSSAAYMLGLHLQSEHVTLRDLATALQEFEPNCAALAAQRRDRAKSVVPELRRVNDLARASLSDGPSFTDLGRRFHDEVVRGCGNQTAIAVVGSLEALWTGHEQRWAERSAACGEYPSMARRRSALKTHEALADAIEAGDADRARRLAARHLADAQAYVLGDEINERIIVSAHSNPLEVNEWRSFS
ncbi:GntR family transcriptional regulator [Mycobacteriaceae bacterium 1482268.1]|nr:GntR family transcriptional regulator [Mycobacteriaceae bacterium 1482268.1]